MSLSRDRNIREQEGLADGRPINSRLLLLSYSLLFALVAATLSGYHYGLSDHAEQLPIIFRALDPGYLSNDFFVNSASGFGPRSYYSRILAFVAGYVPLDAAMAVIWLFCFVAVIVVTAFAAKDITGSVLGGTIAALLVTLSAPFHLGSEATVFAPSLIPRFLAMPLGLLAIWKGIKNQPIHAAVAAIPAVIVHPTIGLETAGLALVATGANRLFYWRVRREITMRQVWTLAAAVVIVGLTSLPWIIPTIRTEHSFSLETEDLVTIYAYFRDPHHLVPSTWGVGQWALGAGFAYALVIALIEKFRRHSTLDSKRREFSAIAFAITSILLVIAAALVGGYVFVEVIPTRPAVMAQMFRMVVVAAWLGWILMAGVIAEFIMSGRWSWAALFVSSAVSAPTLFVFTGVTFVASKLSGGATFRSKVFFAGVAILVFDTMVLTKVWMGQPTIRDVLLIASGLPVVLTIAYRGKLKPVAFAALAGALVATSTSLALDRYDLLPKNIPFASSFLAKTQPILTLDQAFRGGQDHAEDRTLIMAAKNYTPADAVFLVPWDWQYWRLFANRAVVVERKAFPFQERAMKEWYDRYLDIYDEGAGYPHNVTESGLLELQRRYGFHYAVVPVVASMSFPVTATSEHWKIVQLAETGH